LSPPIRQSCLNGAATSCFRPFAQLKEKHSAWFQKGNKKQEEQRVQPIGEDGETQRQENKEKDDD